MRQTGTLTAAAWAALEEVYPKLPRTHEIAKELEVHFTSLGIKSLIPVETNMVFMDLEAAGLKNAWFDEEAAERGVKFGFDGRVVVHHQISDEAVQALKASVEAVMTKKAAGVYDCRGDEPESGGYGSMRK